MNGEKAKVLIVDDRQENLLAMTSILQSQDYCIATASSGEEALRAVLQEEFALILMDVQMPGLNGFDTVKLIKSREKSQQIPIIFVTALSHATEHILTGYEVGAIDFLFKPIHPTALRHKVEQFVGMYMDRKQLQNKKELISRRTAELEEANQRLVLATKELQRLEALARVVGETANDTFLTLDEQGCIITVNPAVQPMFGYLPQALAGQPIGKLLPELDGLLVESFEIGKEHELIAQRSDGSIFPGAAHFGCAHVADRCIWVVSLRDITEQKMHMTQLEEAVEQRTCELREANSQLEEQIHKRLRMSEELRLSYEQINDILESMTDAFFSLDAQWRITHMNKTAEQLLDKPRSEVLHHSIWNFAAMSELRSYDLLKMAMEQRIPAKQELFSQVGQRWVELRVFPSKRGISVFISDLTEMRQMQRDVRNSQERFYTIFKASPSLMAIQSLKDSTYVDVNESWLRHTGYAYEQIVEGAADLCLSMEPEEDLTQWSGQTVSDVKIQYKTRTGEQRTGLMSTEIIEIPDEPCLLTVITDITDRVGLENELQRLDRLHMIGEMAAGIAHEIRNPMTTVRGFLQLMRSRLTLPNSDVLDVMVEELNRANGIISEFLALAKNKTYDLKLQSLNEIIEAIFPLIQAEATLSGKAVKLGLEPGAELELDEKEIRQMILNLTLNGLEAMEEGGLLTISTYKQEDELVLEVSDQGHGIPQKVLDKIGTPFLTTKEKGTGLGLAVCFSIAARHRAKLTWQTSSAGTTFYVAFQQAHFPEQTKKAVLCESSSKAV